MAAAYYHGGYVGPQRIAAVTAPAPSQRQVDSSRAVLWLPAATDRGADPCIYWAPISRCPQGNGVIAYSTEDKAEFAYDAFNEGRDFGPLDIARTVMYCHWVDALLSAHAGCAALVHLASDISPQERVNSATLCCAYLVLARGYGAEQAYQAFQREPLRAFLDCRGDTVSGSAIADELEADFELSVLDVLRGLERARNLGWLDYQTFGVEDHAQLLRPENGDMSWLIPGIALALASPWSEHLDQDGLAVCTPAMLSPYMLGNGVNVVIQCNDADREEEGERRRLLQYDGAHFEAAGIRHVPMPFEDGGCPSVEILLRFLEVVRSSGGGFAVHCRSGLGRTATLIGVYAMQNLGFTARSFIGWARVMRPGTVHGSQQEYLCNLEHHLRPGAPRPLESLDQRERLHLLPRRELRFWALDSGIAAGRTRHASDHEIVDMILTAHGLNIPSAPTMHVVGQTAPNTMQAAAAQPRNVPFLRPALEPGAYAAAEPPKLASQPKVPSSHTGLREAIAILTHGASLQLPSVDVANTTASAAAGDTAAEPWDDVLRYLRLVEARQADLDTATSWQDVRERVERLQAHRPQVGAPTGKGLAVKTAFQEVQKQREAASREAKRSEEELQEAADDVRRAVCECEELRARLAAEREERAEELRQASARQLEASAEVAREAVAMEAMAREVEELLGRLLRYGFLEAWQVEQAERLRADVRKATEGGDGGGEMDAIAAETFDGPALGSSAAPFQPIEEVPWEGARRSIEEVRERFQLAVQQAHTAIAAN